MDEQPNHDVGKRSPHHRTTSKGPLTMSDSNTEIDEETMAGIRAYYEARANLPEEVLAEERYELRAAFGAGAEVVDIFTGETQIV